MTDKNPDASPQFNRSRSSSRRHRKPGDRALWQIGAAAAPPVAVLGLALAVFGFLQPAIAVIPLLRSTAYLIVFLCVVSLVLILFDVRPGSTRLRRGKVWLAIALAVVAIPSLLYVERRATRIEGNYTAPTVAPSEMELPPGDR